MHDLFEKDYFLSKYSISQNFERSSKAFAGINL
jgi:hypothetical protein